MGALNGPFRSEKSYSQAIPEVVNYRQKGEFWLSFCFLVGFPCI